MIPYAPRERFTQPNRISDLILRSGEAQADAQMRSGQIWGNALGNVGKIASNAVTDYGEAKAAQKKADAISRRDEAMFRDIEEAEARGEAPNPILFSKRYGPDGAAVFKGYVSMREAASKPGTEAQAALPDILAGYSKLSPGAKKLLYEGRLKPLAEKSGWVKVPLPEEWTPELDGQILSLREAFGSAQKPKDQKIVNAPDGTPMILGEDGVAAPITMAGGAPLPAAPAKPETRSLELQLADALAKGDQAKASAIKNAIKQAADAGRAPRGPEEVSYTPKLIVVDGQEIQANYNSKTGKYHDPETGAVLSGIQSPPTADMRNKGVARKLVKKSLESMKSLSEKVITKIGPAQRAKAIKEGAEAVFGMDPTFRTYQDARYALAGNLAVNQQGARPSDSDIKTIWLPMVPDPYRDTSESAAMKWDLINQMSMEEGSKEDPAPVAMDGRKPGPGAARPNTGAPKVGEQRTINGQRAFWDGKGWLPL